MVLYGTIDSLIDFFSFTAWIFYGGAMLALIVMRYTKPNYPRPYKVSHIFFVMTVEILVLCSFLGADNHSMFGIGDFVVFGSGTNSGESNH